jgi:hypothetical protein
MNAMDDVEVPYLVLGDTVRKLSQRGRRKDQKAKLRSLRDISRV